MVTIAVTNIVTGVVMFPIEVATITFNQIVDTVRTVVNQISAKIEIASSAPQVIPVVVVMLVLSALWFPFHPWILEFAQGCWSCTGRQTVELVADVMDVAEPPMTRIFQYANIASRAPGVVATWLLTLFLKCDGTVRALERVRVGTVYASQAVSVEIGLVTAAMFARDTDVDTCGVAAALACDAVAEWIDAVAEVGDCMCATGVIGVESLAIVVPSNNSKCVVKMANAMAIETISQVVKTVYRASEYGVDVLTWLFYTNTRWIAVQRDKMHSQVLGLLRSTPHQHKRLPPRVLSRISGEFPVPNLTYILPQVDLWADLFNTMSYCGGDLTDDVVNAMLYFTLQGLAGLNSNGPLSGSLDTGALLQDWRPGELTKGGGPVIAETIRYGWNTFRELATSTSLDDALAVIRSGEIDRVLDAYESFCISAGDSFFGVFPASMVGSAGLANNTIFQNLIIGAELSGLTLAEAYSLLYLTMAAPTIPMTLPISMYTPMGVVNAAAMITALYGGVALPVALFPNTTESGCRATVSFARAIIHIIIDLPTHGQFVDRKYFDCTLHHMHNMAVSLGAEVNRMFDMVPAIDSCRLVFDNDTPIPRLSCSRPLLLGSLGELSHGTTDLMVTLLNYGLTCIETTGSLDNLLSVPTDPIFDNITFINQALGHATQGLISSIAPLHLLSFEWPGTNITIHIDRVIGEHLVGLFVERSLNSLVEFGRLGVRLVQSNFNVNVSHIQDFANNQRLLVNTTAELISSVGCALKNAMDESGYDGDRCLYRMAGVCPLDLVLWCDKEAYFSSIDVYNQLVLTLVQMALLPARTFDRKLFSDVLGSLETTISRIPFLVPLNNLTVDWSDVYGTNETLDVTYAVAELLYFNVKMLSAGNRGMLEIFHAIARGTDPYTTTGELKHELCSDPLRPVFDPSSLECKACNEVAVRAQDVNTLKQQLSHSETYDSCSVYVSTGSACCPRSGKCFDGPCYNPALFKAELDIAMGNLNQGFDDLFRVLGLADKHLQMMATRLSRSSLNVINGVVQSVLVSPEHLKDASYALDDFGWAAGHAVAIPISFVGHMITLIGALPGVSESDKKNIKRVTYGIGNLTGSMAAVANAYMTVSGDTVAYVLDGVAAILEGDTSSARYVNITQLSMAAIEADLMYCQVAVRTCVANLDISQSNKMCNISKFVEMNVEVGSTVLAQVTRVWARAVTMAAQQPVSSLPPIMISGVFQSLRRWSTSFGVIASDVTRTIASGVLTQAQLNAGERTFAAIGGVISTSFNLFISTTESIYQLIFLFLKDGLRMNIISEVYTPTSYIVTIAKAFAIWIRSIGTMVSTTLSIPPTLFTTLADFIMNTFGNPTSVIVDGMAQVISIDIAFFRLIISWMTGDTSAVSNYTTQLQSFIQFVIDQIVDQSAIMLDNMLWPSVHVLGGIGPLQCLSILPTCVWAFVENWASDIWDLIESFFWNRGTNMLPVDPAMFFQVIAILTPLNNTCHGIFMELAAQIELNGNTQNATSVVLSKMQLGASWKLQQCMQTFATSPTVGLFLQSRNVTTTKRRSSTLTEYITCIEQGDSSANCIIDSTDRVSKGMSLLWNAIKIGMSDGPDVAAIDYYNSLMSMGLNKDTALGQATAFAQSFQNIQGRIGNLSSLLFGGDDTRLTGTTSAIIDVLKSLAFTLDMEVLGSATTNTSTTTATTTTTASRATSYTFSSLPGWCGANTSSLGIYAIASSIDVQTLSGCTDDNQYNDDYGCFGNRLADYTPIDPTQVESIASGAYPLNATNMLVIENPCPRIYRCPGYRFAESQLLDNLCETTCAGRPSSTILFETVCMKSGIRSALDGTLVQETWVYRPGDWVAQLNITSLVQADVASVMGPHPDAICAAIGNGDMATTYTFCRDRCNINVAGSYAASVFGSENVPLAEFVSTLCLSWCLPDQGSCVSEPSRPIDCTIGATQQTACLARCPVAWISNGIPIEQTTCTPSRGINCAYHDPATVRIYDTSCACPPNSTMANIPERCWYVFGASENTSIPSGYTGVSFCPTMTHPVYSFFDGVDYGALSLAARVKVTKSVVATPIIKTTIGNIPSGTRTLSYMPSQLAVNAIRTSATQKSAKLEYSDEVYAAISTCLYGSTRGNNLAGTWNYDNTTRRYWMRLPDSCMINGTFTEYRYGPNTTVDITTETPGSICAIWGTVVTDVDCSPIPVLDTGVVGLCDSSACTTSSTYATQISLNVTRVRCQRDAHCAKGKYEPIRCRIPPTQMTMQLCGTVPVSARYTYRTITPMPTATPVRYLWANGTLLNGILMGITNVSLWSDPLYQREVYMALQDVDDPIISNRQISPFDFVRVYGLTQSHTFTGVPLYNNRSSSAELDLLASTQPITFTNIPFNGTRTTALPISHTITYASSTDFCSSLCPGERYCTSMLNQGVNCTWYRKTYPGPSSLYMQTPYARLWLCEVFPNTNTISTTNFPLSTTQDPSKQQLPHTLYSGLSTHSCPGVGPCILNAPHPTLNVEDRDNVPLDPTQCELIRQYTDNKLLSLAKLGVQIMDSVIDNQIPTRRTHNNNNQVSTRTTVATKALRTYSLPRSRPIPYTDWMDTPTIPHQDLPIRRCLRTLDRSCARCETLRTIPLNSTIAFLQWQASDQSKFGRREQGRDPAVERLFEKLHGLTELVDYVMMGRDGVAFTPRELDSVGRVKAAMGRLSVGNNMRYGNDTNNGEPPSLFATISRAIGMASCRMRGSSHACRRIERVVAVHGHDIVEYKRRRDASARHHTVRIHPHLDITNAAIQSYRDSIIPSLAGMPRHCYVLFTSNWTDILTQLYFWRVVDRDGPVGQLWDAFMMDRAILGYALSPDSDGSELYLGGGPIATLDLSKLSGPIGDINMLTSWLSNAAVLRGVNQLIIKGIGSAIKVTPASTNPSDIAMAIMAAAQGRNTSNITTAEFSTWVRNTNMVSDDGQSVGLLYYMTAFVPFYPDYAKISGELRLFGVVPIWNPACGIPIWAPKFVRNMTRALANRSYIAPEWVMNETTHATERLAISIPFTTQCPVEPHAKSLFEYLSSPIALFFRLGNMVMPAFFESSIVRLALVPIGLDGYNTDAIGTTFDSDPWTGLWFFITMFVALLPWLIVFYDSIATIVFSVIIVIVTVFTRMLMIGANIMTLVITLEFELLFGLGIINRARSDDVLDDNDDDGDDSIQSVVGLYTNQRHHYE